MSTEEKTAPAIGATWFNLSRHAEDPAPAAAGGSEPDTADTDDAEAEQMLADATATDAGESDSDDETEQDDDRDDEAAGLGDAGKKALDRMKSERAAAKKEAAAAKKQAAETRKQLAEMQRKVEAFEDRDKSDLEKAQAAAERAKDQAAKAVARSVTSEIKVAASGQFADPSDAVDVLMRDPSRYVSADGEIDADAIQSDLADLLERKPHWAVPAPAAEPEAPKKPRPKADPAQGSRGPVPPTNFLTASDDEVAAELSKLGYRQRSK